MLGDNSEKSKNPLKKAMRRRNAKSVNFAAPTYIEASDVEYSTDEDDEHGDFFDDETETVESEDGELQEHNDDIVVEPLRPKPLKEKPAEQAVATDLPDKQEPGRASGEPRRSSEDSLDSGGMHATLPLLSPGPDPRNSTEPTVSRSRNGTVRNTDSFFKDDTAEPKKISLTPNLLRDESSNNSLSNEFNDGRGSFESIEKASSASEKPTKDEKKRKEKKPGMLSGLFKRKDKKSKSTDEDSEEPLSPGESTFRGSPQPKTSIESLAQESRAKPPKQAGNKLQKQPPATMSPTSPTSPTAPTERTKYASSQSLRQIPSLEASSLEGSRNAARSPATQPSPSKEVYATPLESRDPFASPVDPPSSENRGVSSERPVKDQTSVTSPPQKFAATTLTSRPDQNAESPVDVSPLEGHIPISAPGLTPDTSNRGQSVSPLSAPSSPETDANESKDAGATHGSLDTISVDTPTWSDASLRSYLDEENDIRDLFIIVHDKTNIPPAGPDHPVTGRLFKEESRRLKEMNNQLDEMLVKWMYQRSRPSSTMRT